MFLIGRINIVKRNILPNASYRFNVIPIKLLSAVFTELKQTKKNLRIHIETKRTLNSQSNLGKEEWTWWINLPWLQIILQSYSHQDNMVLDQKQKYRPTEQNRNSRDKPTHPWAPYFWPRRQEYAIEQR